MVEVLVGEPSGCQIVAYTQAMWLPLQLLSVLCWACVNLMDSVLVEHYHKKPYALQWHQSYFSMVILAVLFFFFGSWTQWSVILLLAGALTCFGDWIFFALLDRIDVSLTHIAWSMMAIMLSIAGFLFFGESWSHFQIMGVVLLLAGVLLLTLWGKTLTPANLLFLFVLALLNVPFYLAQKAALSDSLSPLQTFFWSVMGREGISLVIPLIIPSWRREVFSLFPRMTKPYFFINAAVIMLFFSGVALNTLAFDIGPMSLSVIVTNIQPFIILLLAYLLYRFLPGKAAKEVLTGQSLRVKIVSFSVVFAGLAFLSIPQ